MKTVKQLKNELDKFPDDALCHAYEGLWELNEPTGVVISKDGQQGIIHCSERGDDKHSTEMLE